ncbi:hypothetical protein [Micropruina sonneratiae]|uniref:hypothetical protein n=1 Tax=Micropruina sonneratiae TaxID=2986940 RepID=UPI002226C3AB|nr:hypothetical protein [Micropruina sp. KQZ13P-5]MCW3159591.1 hypothetical protein [Micropruina sp. KQZ13P-5]
MDLSWLKRILFQLEDPDQRRLVPRQTDNYLFIEPFEHLSAGEVLFTSGSGGGRPISCPHDVVTAASTVLAQSRYADVARKLAAYGGVERHVVLVVDSEKDPTFEWLRNAEPGEVDQLPAPTLATDITHLWITPRYIPGLTIAWSAGSGWMGTEWRWGHPVEALAAWHDPACPDDHSLVKRN